VTREIRSPAVAFIFMGHAPVDGDPPAVPLPERNPAALRAAVARLDPAALARFEAHWTAATARAHDEYSLLPARYFVEHWWSWVAVEQWLSGLSACMSASVSSPIQRNRRNAERLRLRSARSCARPRQLNGTAVFGSLQMGEVADPR
jgi:hypothetical protein